MNDVILSPICISWRCVLKVKGKVTNVKVKLLILALHKSINALNALIDAALDSFTFTNWQTKTT